MKKLIFFVLLPFVLPLCAQKPYTMAELRDAVVNDTKSGFATVEVLRNVVKLDTIDITKNSPYIPAEKVLLTQKASIVVILELAKKINRYFSKIMVTFLCESTPQAVKKSIG